MPSPKRHVTVIPLGQYPRCAARNSKRVVSAASPR